MSSSVSDGLLLYYNTFRFQLQYFAKNRCRGKVGKISSKIIKKTAKNTQKIFAISIYVCYNIKYKRMIAFLGVFRWRLGAVDTYVFHGFAVLYRYKGGTE